jgi:tRNA threonylcarbamoyladenosine biosynthesis protein TsaE
MAILDDRTIDFTSSSADQTVRLGVRLGGLLQPNDTLCLSGELGAGKTAFARGVGRGWGTAVRVTSPSFTLINQYPRAHDNRILYHIDCYRLESVGEIITVGLDDIFASTGAFMIEWPERIEKWLPTDRLWIQMSYLNETRRKMRFRAVGDRSTQLLKQFKRSAFGA